MAGVRKLLGSLIGPRGIAGPAGPAWSKGRLTGSNDAFALPAGVYTIHNGTTAAATANLPEELPGTLVVPGSDAEAVNAVVFYPAYRDYFYTSSSAGISGHRPWQKHESVMRGNIYTAVDAFTLTPGIYTIGSGTFAEGVANLPEKLPGSLFVIGNSDQIVNALMFYPAYREYHWEANSYGGTGFRTWRRVRHVDAGLANQVRREEWSRRRGGVKRISTAAIALRFDHGLANFNSKIRPLLEARGLPYSLALNSDRWSISENTGVTAAMVNGWVLGGLCEIWNHGRTHAGFEGEIDWQTEIVTGLTELQSQIPAAQIDGFVIPGTGGVGYGDFGAGSTAAEFYETPAGRMILEHHAVSTGYIAGTGRRLLDGTTRQGQFHYTMDEATFSNVRSQIDAAQSEKSGLQLMLHPSLVDTTGYITTAALTQVLDHIVAERNAGRLAVLSPYDLLLADSRPAVQADTGWRDISASVTGRTTGALRIKREGRTVWLDFDELAATTQGNDWLTWANIIPAGFRAPRAWTYQPLSPRSTEHAAGPMRVNTAGALLVYGAHTERRMLGTVSWTTSEPWPTTLPGVPA